MSPVERIILAVTLAAFLIGSIMLLTGCTSPRKPWTAKAVYEAITAEQQQK